MKQKFILRPSERMIAFERKSQVKKKNLVAKRVLLAVVNKLFMLPTESGGWGCVCKKPTL